MAAVIDAAYEDADEAMRDFDDNDEDDGDEEENDSGDNMDGDVDGKITSSDSRAGVTKNEEITTDVGNVTVGGIVAKEGLCLLDGFVDVTDRNDVITADSERVTLFIKRVPAFIGRTHVTSDKNFVGLGGTSNGNSPNGKNNKAVSRQHVRIDYRVPTSAGGCGHIQSKVGFRSEFFYNATDDPISTTDIRILPSSTSSTLPTTGFYTLTCLGKNRVVVNGSRIDPGETVWITSGNAIRIANYLLYFLTPTGVIGVRKTIQIRDDIAPIPKKRKLSLGVSSARPAVIGSGAGEGIVEDKVTTTAGANSNRSSKTLQSEIEALSTTALLKEMKIAFEEDVWDRRHHLIGSTLSYRAVVAATHDTEWYKADGGHVSRSTIMDWIASSSVFGEWVKHMLSKLEPKSYQASITKAMIKAGYTRTSSSGRYIKWIVPPPLFISEGSSSSSGRNAKQTTKASFEGYEQEFPIDENTKETAPTDSSEEEQSDDRNSNNNDEAKDDEASDNEANDDEASDNEASDNEENSNNDDEKSNDDSV
jgi:FHA domain